ncbi:hypothetical protein BC835DRAFT_1411327 [Cytidiella melzeri]|nr:hypothetical protein BC835DRAFT_1411327 [Cytidiella melzeri]
MPSSLEPLSSPSPSPSPSPLPPDTRASTSNNSGAGAGLDSGSELSELTEDEQDNVNSKADREERSRPSRRGRKRGGIVPAPMWDWAYKNSKKDWKSKMLEEEEEDDQSRPTEVGEEEDVNHDRSRSQSGASSLPERRAKRKSSTTIPVDDEEDEVPVRGSDIDEDSVSIDAVSVVLPPDDTLNDPDYVSDEDEAPSATAVNAHETHGSGSRGASPEATDDENAENDDIEPADADPQDEDDVLDGNAAGDSEDEPEDGVEDVDVPSAPALSTMSSSLVPPTASAAVNAINDPESMLTLMDVDTAPVPEQVSPIHAAAASSSIMAGSALIAPPSPSSSASSAASPNQSPTSSRSPSPEPLSDREPETRRGSAKTRAKAKGGRNARNKSRRKTKADTVLEHDADQDQLPGGDADDGDGDIDDADADSPEMDVELELQPAHRAEALDVLATIELKFAMLRESAYVDKMENLAWEEALVAEGIHPEMLHLHTELSKRRDKRLELASRRRDYEVANATKRRKLDEDGVWSWWKLRRDELQTQMICETNRKRRKLDRERRALDRPQPVRRIPSPPRDVPPAPYTRDLFRSSPLDAPAYKKHQLRESELVYPQLSALAPVDIANDLEFLFAHRRNLMGIDAARAGLVAYTSMGGGLPTPLAYEQLGVGMGMGIPDGASRFPHVPFQQSVPTQGVLGQMLHGFSGPGGPNAPRLMHHHSAPPGALPGVHAQIVLEQEAALGGRANSGVQPGPYISHYPPGMPVNLARRSISPVLVQPTSAPSGTLPNGPTGKNSSRNPSGSSVNVQAGKEHKRLTSIVRPVEGDAFDQDKEWASHLDQLKAKEKDERGRDVMNDSRFERERARERERDRDNDRESERDLDRTGHVPAVVPVQRPPSHQHPIGHLHPSSSQANHHHPPHHHHHHHHHVHHHHHPNNTGPTGGPASSVTALHPSNSLSSRHASPHPIREFERRAHSGAPVEVIDLPLKPPASAPVPVWKPGDEPPNLASDERGRRNNGPSGHERVVPHSYPTSPRSVPGVSNAPAAIVRSRGESWGVPDDSSQPRPSSSSSTHFPNTSAQGPPRIPPAGNTTPRPQISPSTRPSPVMISPSRHNSIRLPPLSPSLAAGSRSPLRLTQALPGTSFPPIPDSSNPSSPKTVRRTSPPVGRLQSPGLARDIHSQMIAGSHHIPTSQKAAPKSPSVFAAQLSHSSLPASRLPVISAEAHPAPAPKVSALPVE